MTVCDVAASNVMPRRPATAMDHVIKENVVQPPVIRPKPQTATTAPGANDQVGCAIPLLAHRFWSFITELKVTAVFYHRLHPCEKSLSFTHCIVPPVIVKWWKTADTSMCC